MEGCKNREQALLGALVRGHRRKFPLNEFDELPAEEVITARRLCVLLRLAVALRRSRSAVAMPRFRVVVTSHRLRLEFPPQWLEGHPLTRADLEEESRYLVDAGFELDFD